MENKRLLEELGHLGYPLLLEASQPDAQSALLEMAKSKNLRLWEGFPVVLANAGEKGLLDFGKLSSSPLAVVSLALYKSLGLKFSWSDKLYKALSAQKQKECKNFFKCLSEDKDLKVNNRVLSAQRLKAAFSLYYRHSESRLAGLLSTKEEFGLEFALSQVFSPKQKELFLRKLSGEKFTKTEKEYFSRAVKKKTQALANEQLHRLALKALG